MAYGETPFAGGADPLVNTDPTDPAATDPAATDPAATNAPAPLVGRTLLTGPAGSGKTHAALVHIRGGATTPGPRGRGAAAPGEALLVLPTYAQVMHVKRRALSRWNVRGLLDQPFTTFTAAGERFLPTFRVRTLPSGEERDRLMEEALRQRDEAVFREVADRPGFRAHLLRLVKEIKQTGLEGGEAREHLAAGRDLVRATSRVKLEAFLSVFEAYEDLLERAALEDHEDALRRLAQRLETSPPARPPTLLVVDGFDDFSRVEERILDALADAVTAAGGAVLVTLPWDEARPHLFATSRTARAHLLARDFREERLAAFPRSTSAPLAAIAERLFGRPGEPVAGGEDVQRLIAGDAEDEAETVARAVRAVVTRPAPQGLEGVVRGWRDVGVVVRRLGEHAASLERAFERLGIPLRVIGPGEALASEPLVRALRGALAVLAGAVAPGAFDAPALIEWLRWRALLGGAAEGLPAPEVGMVDVWDAGLRAKGFPTDFAVLLEEAPDGVRPLLAALRKMATRLAAARGPAALYDGLADAILSLTYLPAPSGFDADGRPLDLEHDRRLARAVQAQARTVDILAALRGAAERTGLGGAADVADAVQELGEALEQTTLRLADRRLDAVTLMDAEEARFWELPVVVVAGLEEGGFPVRPDEDVLLRDDDREALRHADDALRLPLARDREARERRLFYAAVTRARRRLLLTRRAYDDKGDPKGASTFLGELEAVVTPQEILRARTPGRVARRREACYTPSDWRLFAAAHLGPWAARHGGMTPSDRALATALQQEAGTPVPARMARARRRRADALWQTPDEEAHVLAQFVASTDLVSASRLNQAVRCPYRFFLRYVASIESDDLTLDGPVFDQRAKGTALHHAFECALHDPDRSSEDLAREGVTSVGARGLEARLLEVELRRALDLLRHREESTAGDLRPWTEGLEFEFGYDEPVELGTPDCRFRIGGAVDRIDRTDGLVTIVDYKRSAGSVDAAFKKARDGQDLQVPLYARAIEIVLGVRVVGFEWMAGLTRARRVLHDAAAEDLFLVRREANPLESDAHEAFRGRIEAAEATATDVVRRTRRGEHMCAPSEPGTCAACDWASVCRPDVPWLESQILPAEHLEEDAS